MAVRTLLVACMLSAGALAGCQAQSKNAAAQPVFTSAHDKDMFSFFGTKPVDVTLLGGKTLRGCTFMGTTGRDDKDFIKLRDWMGTNYIVRFEHIVSIKK